MLGHIGEPLVIQSVTYLLLLILTPFERTGPGEQGPLIDSLLLSVLYTTCLESVRDFDTAELEAGLH